MEGSCSKIKEFFIFSQKKTFLIFWEMEIPQKFLIFQETELFYISGNRTLLAPKKLNKIF